MRSAQHNKWPPSNGAATVLLHMERLWRAVPEADRESRESRSRSQDGRWEGRWGGVWAGKPGVGGRKAGFWAQNPQFRAEFWWFPTEVLGFSVEIWRS